MSGIKVSEAEQARRARAARTDTERLDYLDEIGPEGICEGEHLLWSVQAARGVYVEADNLRDAIDAAMEAEEADGE